MSDLVRIKKQHDHTVDADWNGYHEWINTGELLVLDSMTRPNPRMSRYSSSRWAKWACNNPDCDAWAVVSDQLAQTAIEHEEARWTS